MLKTLEIRGFHAFESYRLTHLARVNLMVGRNNCGKTSVLEAIELLVSGGHPTVFQDSALRRGEVGVPYARRAHGHPIDVSHVFFGHEIDLGTRFELSPDDGRYTLSVRVRSLDEIGEDPEYRDRKRKWLRQGALDPNEEPVPMFGLSIDGGPKRKQVSLPVSEDGTIPFEPHPRSIRNATDATLVRFLTSASFAPASIRRMWDTILTEGREAEIVDDMRRLEPDLDAIHFLTSDRPDHGILIGLRNGGRRLPIGTYGDGMRRLLALRLSFVGMENGFLLIDEIDTGLHWTIMEAMWQLIVELARTSNVQIFATTQNRDCIHGLGALIQSRPDLKEEVSIQKVDTSLKQATCLRGDQIKVAVEQDIAVR